MPIYEYECADCGHRLEAIQKVADAPLTQCPTCGKPGLKRLISAAGFQLKGTGWYVTDFKNSGQKQAAKQGGDKPAGEKQGGEAKSEGAGESSGTGSKAAGGGTSG